MSRATRVANPPRLASDAGAGLVVFLVAIPLCLGMALASGAPLISGLIAGIVGGIVVGALSGSHVSVSGPSAALAAVVIAQIHGLGSFEAFLAALVIAGVMQVLLGTIRAGVLSTYFPTNVVKGVLAAVGVLLIIQQVPHLVGQERPLTGDLALWHANSGFTAEPLRTAAAAFHPGAILVGVLSLGTMFVWEVTALKKLPIPSQLAAVALGTIVSAAFAGGDSVWANDTTYRVHVPVVGEQGLTWSSLLIRPDFSHLWTSATWVAAGVIALAASLDTLVNLQAADHIDPQRKTAPPNRELVAQGIGNTVSGLLGGLVVSSAIVRSSVNINAGGHTRRATIIHGVLLAAAALTPALLNEIPLAALAAVLIYTGWTLAKPQHFASMWTAGPAQFIPFAITVLAILATDMLLGVSLGMAASFAFILWANSRCGLDVIEEQHLAGVVHRVQLGTQATFLNRSQLASALGRFGEGDRVLIDGRLADHVDPDFLAQVREYVHETAPRRGVRANMIGFRHRYGTTEPEVHLDFTTQETRGALDAARVLGVLQQGNERFAGGRRLYRDPAKQFDLSLSTRPIAAVLSCSDLRVPVESIFDQGVGELLNVCLAGNVAGPKAIGSLEYACAVAGAKAIVVLGHTRCGAVRATCDMLHRGTDLAVSEGLTNLHAITGPITEAAHRETQTTTDRTGANLDFVNRVAAIHVQRSIDWLLANSPTLARMHAAEELSIAGAMFDAASGTVRFLEATHAD